MSAMRRRVSSLEKQAGTKAPVPESITLQFAVPGPDGPVETGYATATILVGPNKGLQLYRDPGETKEAFEHRVQDLVNA